MSLARLAKTAGMNITGGSLRSEIWPPFVSHRPGMLSGYCGQLIAVSDVADDVEVAG